MADQQEKTEQPTPRRLSKAREEGSLPSSTEFLSAITLITLTATTYFMGPLFLEWAAVNAKDAFSCDRTCMESPQSFLAFFAQKLLAAALICTPFLLALMISGVAASLGMHGLNLSARALRLRFDLLNPSKMLGEMFSTHSAVKLVLSVIKLVFISILVYFYLKNRIALLATMQWAWSMELLSQIGRLILGVMIRLCVGLLFIGVIDFIYQRWRYFEGLKMTKQEVREEMRSTEGPPEAHRRIRQMQFEAVMRRMLQDVPKANVVLVNPTHVAVALQYDPKTMHAPIVVAKGADNLSEKIREIARAYGIPIIRRPAIARELYATVDLGRAIPEGLFVAVAEVLALIHRLKHQRR
ncbi:MAG: flagellar biosynthesis protein FlhB [Sedimentisphaerales bacterium]|nr:flagellar biosynthesis protein FlhB [Sedimentisphaerales bacterium]